MLVFAQTVTFHRLCAVVTKTTDLTLDFSCLQYSTHFVCSTVEHVYYGHPNVIINKCNEEWEYAFTLQDIIFGASQYVLSAIQLQLADTRKEKDTSNLHLADCSIRGY